MDGNIIIRTLFQMTKQEGIWQSWKQSVDWSWLSEMKTIELADVRRGLDSGLRNSTKDKGEHRM